MKQFLAIVFALLTLFAVTACDDSKDDEEGKEDAVEEVAFEETMWEITASSNDVVGQIWQFSTEIKDGENTLRTYYSNKTYKPNEDLKYSLNEDEEKVVIYWTADGSNGTYELDTTEETLKISFGSSVYFHFKKSTLESSEFSETSGINPETLNIRQKIVESI